MKIFSDGANPDADSLQKAQGCLASNLALPGLGSLAGGRKIGVIQLVVCLSSFALTLGGGVHFILWMLAHWAEFHGANVDPDPFPRLQALWQEGRWPFLGIALFIFSWVWALFTGWSLLAAARAENSGR